MPAQILPAAVTMLANPRAQPLDLVYEPGTRHLVQILVHAALTTD
jgi:hypothetical protein